MSALEAFHPAVRTWFERRFPDGPTEPQQRGWPTIACGRDTLIAAPTGTGKTLSAFLVCIDRLFRAAERFELRGDDEPDPALTTEVVYVSPLKALAADIHTNLAQPLAEIREVARELGLSAPDIRVALRSGDTSASARAAMLRKPPHLLVTTPESLYLMVTAERSRELLRGVRTVIVDEIHALARDKRGAHLAITLERLDALCSAPQRPVRIGLSATQRPIETVARLLVGAGDQRSRPDGSPRCEIVDAGHRRELDLGLLLPDAELEAVMALEQLSDVLDQIARMVAEHQTTLVFVNTRRMAERIAHLLAERLGEDAVAAHHGSLSKDRRLRVEKRLRAGDLRALVATASLELGIDIGPVELVCQIGSPRSIATFLQRVGRSGHQRFATPKGRLFPLTRDELVECAGLLRGVRAGRLDALCPSRQPLDILAQQIVAACAAEEWQEDELFALLRRAAHFRELSREDFDAVVEMLAEGIQTGRGRRAAHLHRDRVNGVLRGRRGARLAALTSGGAIPDRADYRVVLDPDETFVGTVDEDWAIESMAGDVFLLGSTSWRIRRVEAGVVRVVDAGGAPPTIPFWLGEAPARSEELSTEVSELRKQLAPLLEAGQAREARDWLEEQCGLAAAAQDQIVRYLGAAQAALGALPTQDEIVFERFFDESGGMQLVVHAPFGGRTNRAFGLALRKRFCRTFDFELQAAANDDAIVLSLGPQHSFPLSEVAHYLKRDTAREALRQAVLASPMFTARWRWNLNRSLAVLRMRGGKRNPPPIQRMEADDLMAAIFPGLAQCQENASGPIEIPDHPIVRQTIDDCLHEAMDVERLEQLLGDLASGAVAARCVDATEPSPLAHEILNGRPYTFLDDAPLEERRTRAVKLRRGLPGEARALARLDPEAIARVREEVRPDPRDADELHDLLLQTVVLRPELAWSRAFQLLVDAGRAAIATTGDQSLWVATERRKAVEALWPDARFTPDRPLPAALASVPAPEADEVAAEAVRGHLELVGPIDLARLARRLVLPEARIELGLVRLEGEGFALRGQFEDERAQQWCARRLLSRIHLYTQERLRKEIEPVSAQDFLRFLLRWQYVAPGTRREGRAGTLAAIEQLQGFEVAAGSWESDVLPARIDGYRPDFLDALCLSGEVAWGRLSVRTPAPDDAADRGKRGGIAPSRSTPVALLARSDVPWLLRAQRGDAVPADPAPGPALDVLEALRQRGALFHSELATLTGRLPVEVEQGLWEGVTRGLVAADGFQAVRSLLGSRDRWARRSTQRRMRRGLRRGARSAASAEGRWAPFPASAGGEPEAYDPDELAEAVAEQLLARWGVVFRDLLVRESLAVPWRELLWALRRMEARGTIRGGRFVTGFVGEQYALPGAVESLRRTRRAARSGELVRVAAADPLNLVGILTPGPRVASQRNAYVLYRDGAVVFESERAALAPAALRTLRPR
ncbi:MAG: DEAD/DEAH box helicase [Myxococcota bacterium]|nr:DEAD/DEAH box helicase [Myxococcota bacterium]